MRRNTISLIALALTTTLTGIASAQTFPTKQAIRLMVPFAPGGTTDLLARVISVKMAATLGQSVVVENKAGAGGALGAAEVSKAAPDGYTLLMSSASTMATNPAINPKTPYDPVADFVHISNVAATPNVIAVTASFAAKDHKSFLEQLRKETGKHSYGSAGQGSIGHLLGEIYKSETKVDISHVAYRGSGPALNDAVGGQVAIVIDNLPTALPFITANRLIAIAVAAPKRVAQLPNVPTFAELGLGSVNRMSFLGVSAPKGTPKEIADKLNASIKAALADASVRERIEGMGAVVVGNSSAEYQAQVRDELEIYKRVVKTQGLKLD
ncbi:MAG: ABC transporter substrate-binding protein [Betaproteobacteria bacterium]|nr:MAG: ABC transporter substrate-binding protein [Betaproteobacteria bacterium]